MNFILKISIFYLLAFNAFTKESLESNSQIESIIEEYLLNNPEVIIKSLENYRNIQEAKMKEGLKSSIKNYYEKKVYESLPYTGDSSGTIVVTEFIDYNCGYCKKTLKIISDLLVKNSDIKIVFVDFPILSETSYIAAKGALAAFEQDEYFKFHSELLTGNKDFSETYILDLAKKLKLDVNKFKKDMNSSLISKKARRQHKVRKRVKY